MKKPFYHTVTLIVRNWSDDAMEAWNGADELIKGITEDIAYKAEAEHAEIVLASSLPLQREQGEVFFSRRYNPN